MEFWYEYASEILSQMRTFGNVSSFTIRGLSFTEDGFIVYWSERGRDSAMACTIINDARRGDLATVSGCAWQTIADMESFGFSRTEDPSHITIIPADPLVKDEVQNIVKKMSNATIRR